MNLKLKEFFLSNKKFKAIGDKKYILPNNFNFNFKAFISNFIVKVTFRSKISWAKHKIIKYQIN
jgi:hypothetical protein